MSVSHLGKLYWLMSEWESTIPSSSLHIRPASKGSKAR